MEKNFRQSRIAGITVRDGLGTGTQGTGNGYLRSRSGTGGTGTQNENLFRNEKEREPNCVPLRSRERQERERQERERKERERKELRSRFFQYSEFFKNKYSSSNFLRLKNHYNLETKI